MKRYVIANWKLYLSVAKSELFARQLVRWERTQKFGTDIEIIIAPSLLALQSVSVILRKARSKIKIAAQDVGFADEGAFTGAVSPRELRRMGVSHVIIGHSERREHFNEDDALLAKKVVAARTAGLKVIYCAGETKEERNESRANDVVRSQLRGVKKNVDLVAYEPRWAIGTGLPIAPAEAEHMHALIAKEVGATVPVCYGGSVTEQNAIAFAALEHTQGVLVGGASTTYKSLTTIVSKIHKVANTRGYATP